MNRNLSKGLNKLFLSQLFNFIGAGAAVFGSTFLAAGLLVTSSHHLTLGSAMTKLLAGLGIVSLVGAVVLIIGGLLQMIGLWQCGKADSRFKGLFCLCIAAEAAYVILSFFNIDTMTLSGLFRQAVGLLSLVLAISALKDSGSYELAERGNRVLKIFFGMCLASAVSYVLTIFGSFGSVLQTPFLFISTILSIWYAIACIRFFGKSSKAFA